MTCNVRRGGHCNVHQSQAASGSADGKMSYLPEEGNMSMEGQWLLHNLISAVDGTVSEAGSGGEADGSSPNGWRIRG